MPFDVVHADALAWEEREPMHGQAPRSHAPVTDAAELTESRARMWRYPAHTRGRRHLDPDQEEVFVPMRGTLTMLVEDPPQRVDVEPGGVVVVHQGTPMQVRNETDEEIVFFAYGAPPCTATPSSSTTSPRSSPSEPAARARPRRRARERLVEAPLRAVGLVRRVRDRAQLDRRHARELARAQDAEALHRLDVAARAAADPAGVAIGSTSASGSAALRAREQRGVGPTRSTRGSVEPASITSQ